MSVEKLQHTRNPNGVVLYPQIMFPRFLMHSWGKTRPGVLQFMGLQRVGHDWATEMNWTEESEGFFFPLLAKKLLAKDWEKNLIYYL